MKFSRRSALTGLAATLALPGIARAEDVLDLDWDDLIPEGSPVLLPPELQGMIDHDGPAALASQQPRGARMRSDLNGRVVRLPGFIVPLDYDGSGVTDFILVPYVGACVHVPPPPANQLVLVTTDEPYDSAGLYEPVQVTGSFGASTISTHLAQVGYALSADRVEPFEI